MTKRFHLAQYLLTTFDVNIEGNTTLWWADIPQHNIKVRASPWLKRIELTNLKDFDVYGWYPKYCFEDVYPATRQAWETLLIRYQSRGAL